MSPAILENRSRGDGKEQIVLQEGGDGHKTFSLFFN